MNQCIWVIWIGLILTGCGLSRVQPQPPIAEATPHQVEQPVKQPVGDQNTRAPLPLSQSISQGDAAADNRLQQDYEPTTPLPETGRLTIRDHIRNLDPARLITNCPTDSAPYAFAESTNYRVQICSGEYDPWLPKYYLGQAKDGSGEIHITNSNGAEAQQLIFKSAGYTYVLYRDAAQSEQVNAYLQVFTPNGEGYAEALLYFYEVSDAPQ
jgi:hypothetical protein